MSLVGRTSTHQNFRQIGFRLDPEDWDDLEIEWLWSEPLGDSEFMLQSLPFFVYGVSFGDVVLADEEDGRLFFVRTTKRGGHSTYRLLLAEGSSVDSPEFCAHWVPLEELGCRFELARTSWLSVDIPPEADINMAFARLELGEADGVWQVFEASLSHST